MSEWVEQYRTSKGIVFNCFLFFSSHWYYLIPFGELDGGVFIIRFPFSLLKGSFIPVYFGLFTCLRDDSSSSSSSIDEQINEMCICSLLTYIYFHLLAINYVRLWYDMIWWRLTTIDDSSINLIWFDLIWFDWREQRSQVSDQKWPITRSSNSSNHHPHRPRRPRMRLSLGIVWSTIWWECTKTLHNLVRRKFHRRITLSLALLLPQKMRQRRWVTPTITTTTTTTVIMNYRRRNRSL